MALALQGIGELLDRHLEGLDPAAIVLDQTTFAANEVDAGSFLGPLLGEEQRSRLEVEGGQATFLRNGRPVVTPPQPTRHHEVDDDEEIVFELEDDSFADPAEARHLLSVDDGHRRLEGSQYPGTGEPDSLEACSDHPRLEALDVDDNVW